MLRRGLAPAALVLAVVVATWLLSGVAVHEIVLFLGYEIAFVALPGAALLWALRGRRSGLLVTIGLGWPLGQTLEILAFSAAAACGLRGVYLVYPAAVVAGSAVVIWRRRYSFQRDPDRGSLTVLMMWTAAAALSLGLIYLALLFLPQVPLPSATSSVAYDLDFPYFIGLTAEVLNHWPATSPGLSGMPLHYEWFVFIHMAAVSQVTRLAIPTIALRLDYVPTMVVIGCQLLVVGRFVGRAAWTGVGAIVVVFLLGPLDLSSDMGGNGNSPFFDLFSYHLWASWTFPFGLMFFLALLYLITERLQAPTWRARVDVGPWVLIALLMVGASGAKATILPVVITGTGLYTLLQLTRRQVSPSAIVTLALAVAIFAVTFVVVYGAGVPGTAIEPLASLARTYPVTLADGIGSPIARAILLPLAYVAGLAGMLLPVAGMLYMLRRRHRGEIPRFTLCICMFVGGLLIANLVHQLSYSELYFQDTGYVAGCIVAAGGLRLAWSDAGRSPPRLRIAIVAAFLGCLILLIAVVAVTSRTVDPAGALNVRYLVLLLGGGTFVVAGTLVLRARHRSTSGPLALALIPLLAATALTSPIELSPTLRRVLTGAPITPAQPDPQIVRGLTPGLLAALHWLRDHSSVDTVFAVSNHWIDPAGTNGKYYYYSAFSERQVFIEAYDSIRYGITTGLATPAGVEFANRQRLNDAVFDEADAGALRVLTQHYSVRFLLIDRIHHDADPAVLRLGSTVLSNRDATVVAVG